MDFWENAGKKAKKAVVIVAGTTLEAGSKLKKKPEICMIKLLKMLVCIRK